MVYMDAKHLRVGELGEDISCNFLESNGFTIIDRNYRKKWGEIDIIAKKDEVLRFIEVKTVSREINTENVIRETLNNGKNKGFQPEDAVHPQKVKRLGRIIQTYLLEKNVSHETLWQFDIMAVFLDMDNKRAKVRFREKVII